MILNEIDFENDIVILDSNMFMTDYMRDYIKNDLVAAILKYREKVGEDYFVYIPRTVIDELENLKQKSGSQFLSERTDALRGLEAANNLMKVGLARSLKTDFTGTANGFNDVAILTMLMELRRHKNISVFSNDRAFSRDLMILNNLHSIKTTKKIRAFYIDIKKLKVKEWLYDTQIDNATRYQGELNK